MFDIAGVSGAKRINHMDTPNQAVKPKDEVKTNDHIISLSFVPLDSRCIDRKCRQCPKKSPHKHALDLIMEVQKSKEQMRKTLREIIYVLNQLFPPPQKVNKNLKMQKNILVCQKYLKRVKRTLELQK